MNLNEISELLKETGVFSLLADADLEKFASHVEFIHYPLGRPVCRSGDEIDAFYVVYSGRARVVSRNADGDEVTVGTLARGQFFGAQGMMGETRHEYTVRAAGDLALLRLTRQDFRNLLDRHPYLRGYFEQYATETSILYFIERSAIFAPLSPQQVRELLSCLHEQSFKADEVIYRRGDAAEAFYIVRSGSIRIVQEELRGKVVRLLKPGDSVGSMAGFAQVSGAGTAALSLGGQTGALVMPKEAAVTATGPLVAPAGIQLSTGDLLQFPEARQDQAAEKNGYLPKRARRYPALLQLSETDCV